MLSCAAPSRHRKGERVRLGTTDRGCGTSLPLVAYEVQRSVQSLASQIDVDHVPMMSDSGTVQRFGPVSPLRPPKDSDPAWVEPQRHRLNPALVFAKRHRAKTALRPSLSAFPAARNAMRARLLQHSPRDDRCVRVPARRSVGQPPSAPAANASMPKVQEVSGK